MTVIENKVPVPGYKMLAKTLTCGECKSTFFSREEIDKCLKLLPEDLKERWDHDPTLKLQEIFTCPNCNHVAEYKEGSKRHNGMLARERKMRRTWGCSGIQRRYR